jgi:hypothetical protein
MNNILKLMTEKSVVLYIGNAIDSYNKTIKDFVKKTIDFKVDGLLNIEIDDLKNIDLIKIDVNKIDNQLLNSIKHLIDENKPKLLIKSFIEFSNEEILNFYKNLNALNYKIYDISPVDNLNDSVGPLSEKEFEHYISNRIINGNFLCIHRNDVEKYNLPDVILGKTCGIICARNDGYKEDERFLIHLNKMLETFDEVIYVDWNSEKGSLLYNVYDHIPRTGKLKHFIIEPEIAKILTNYDSKSSACCGVLALNIAIRRTNAEYLVMTSVDIIPPSKEILTDFIKKSNSCSFYSLSRRDIDYDDILKNKNDLNNYIKYLNENSKPRYFPAKVTPNDNYSMFNCPGDFQLASKNVWLKIKGHEEKMTYACFVDTNVQKKAVLCRFNLIPIYDVPLYHMSHKGMSNDGSSPSKQFYNDAMEWVEYFNESKNEDTWGFSDIDIEYEVL